MSKLEFFKELWGFLKTRKKWWLLPIIVALFLLGIFMIFAANSPMAPFIYPLF